MSLSGRFSTHTTRHIPNSAEYHTLLRSSAVAVVAVRRETDPGVALSFVCLSADVLADSSGHDVSVMRAEAAA